MNLTTKRKGDHVKIENLSPLALHQLAVQSCSLINIFSTIGEPEFVNKIYWMAANGAQFELSEISDHGFTLKLLGVKVLDHRGHCDRDSESVGLLRVVDCSYSVEVMVCIGHYDFETIWRGQRSGQIVFNEGIKIGRQLVELANDIVLAAANSYDMIPA